MSTRVLVVTAEDRSWNSVPEDRSVSFLVEVREWIPSVELRSNTIDAESRQLTVKE